MGKSSHIAEYALGLRTWDPTDLTQAQWELLVPLLPKPKWRKGRPGRPLLTCAA